MPNVPYKCVDCEWAGCRHHNARKCLSCGGTLVATKPRGSKVWNDHNAMQMLRAGMVHHVQRAACTKDGAWVAWKENSPCCYGDDPVEAIYKAAGGGNEQA